MNSASADQLKSFGDGTDPADQICNKSIVVPHRVVTLANSFEMKDRSWYVKSQIPNDLSIQVDDITFHAGMTLIFMRSSPEVYAMYNVDVVQRILEYFLMHEQQQQQQELLGKPSITKLLNNYLAEIAKDPCLPITKFQVLAEALPENAWKCHDGLYRAIDMFLKTHPLLSENERRRLCKTMNCEKLSLDVCLHATQNDRLPLRTIVQVLFSEQVKMRMMMMQDKKPAETKEEKSEGREDKRVSRDDEIKTLKEELENVKKNMAELENRRVHITGECVGKR